MGAIPYFISINDEKVECIFRNCFYGLLAVSLTVFWHNTTGLKEELSRRWFITCCGTVVFWIGLDFLTQVPFLGWLEVIFWMAAILVPAYNILVYNTGLGIKAKGDIVSETISHWFGALIVSTGLLIIAKAFFLMTTFSWILAFNYLVDLMFVCTMVYF